eukprot:CAMPEP_0198225630 /NCGR_PEP_ID=MMETSP1445-20131203/101931_1 /TAXON_ID=36898 /ORGANISM="Pyramimonas sp., Strain CCMP2087" /LENGTH=100 /DNA_ID=CAMNT_0043905217 /DNA_START=86 /DNA_END=388 /DNA_ORIENTATION=+
MTIYMERRSSTSITCILSFRATMHSRNNFLASRSSMSRSSTAQTCDQCSPKSPKPALGSSCRAAKASPTGGAGCGGQGGHRPVHVTRRLTLGDNRTSRGL